MKRIMICLSLALIRFHAGAQENGKYQVENRVLTTSGNQVHLSGAAGDGVAWLKGTDFSNGTIEVDLKGKNVEQQSFLGIAFHGIDVHTLDAIYFRPFNFHSADSAKRLHMVEYVSHPDYTWQVLREKFSGQYEKGLSQPPDPDGWFHVRIEVHYPLITVFLGKDTQPCLSIKQLNTRQSGRIGFGSAILRTAILPTFKLNQHNEKDIFCHAVHLAFRRCGTGTVAGTAGHPRHPLFQYSERIPAAGNCPASRI